EWTINGVLHDFTAVAGSGAAALFSGIHGFNTGIPFIQKHVKGPKWLPFAVGIPSVLLISAASATLGAKEAAETVVLVIDEEGVRSLISELLKGVGDNHMICYAFLLF
ncbi:hypothetical protein MKW94_005247, partial [Papaver nudicaule]|nr:hypothetical protein [Papaver nudicaule]